MGMTVPRASDRLARRPVRMPLFLADAREDLALEPQVAERWRRPANIVVAGVALVLTSPVMLVVAILIKLTSRGPVFYSQTRVGWDRRTSEFGPTDPRRRQDLGGRPFQIYKFRSMYINAEHLTGAVWAAKEDPRVTWLGRYLRQYRLDELPQLLNVLKGDMNIVGPRPERPSIFSDLRQEIEDYPRRQRARPGITGLAQINQQYDTSLDDVRNKVKFDLEYIDRQGLLEDVRIMIKTIPVVLFRRGGW
jgi:lipopolysaccharide/colanic/teichoic acid biosynthesis glycosyltransferase